ncbi:MAG: hypothetical protein V3U84_06690 [Thiotrichaceae bacterium]
MTIAEKLARRLRNAITYTEGLQDFLGRDTKSIRADARSLENAVIALGQLLGVIAEISAELNIYVKRSEELEGVADTLKTEVVNSSLIMQNMMQTFMAFDPTHVDEFLNVVDLKILLASMEKMDPDKLEAIRKFLQK